MVVAAAPRLPAKSVAPVRVASAQPAVENKSEPSRPNTAADKPASNAATPKLFQIAQLSPPVASTATTDPAEHMDAAATPNDVIRARGYWQGPPEGMAIAPLTRAPVRDASAKPNNPPNNPKAAAAAIGGPFHDLRDDAAPGVTLAYAAQPPRQTAAKAAVTGAAALRVPAVGADPQVHGEVRGEQALHPQEPNAEARAVPNGTTVVIKRVANQIASTILSANTSSVVAIKAGARLQNPWLRAVLVAPSVHRFLTTLALGAHDFRSLAALMVKPRSSVMMTFAAEPNPGLDHERFSGPAVVFVSTVSYATPRTAILQ